VKFVKFVSAFSFSNFDLRLLRFFAAKISVFRFSDFSF